MQSQCECYMQEESINYYCMWSESLQTTGKLVEATAQSINTLHPFYKIVKVVKMTAIFITNHSLYIPCLDH